MPRELRLELLQVAPYTGAWIEICYNAIDGAANVSLPTRERGLKFNSVDASENGIAVAPYTGAWIEIVSPIPICASNCVAPYTGA